MFFNSFIFFIFLAIILPVFFLLKGQRAKAVWLLVASYFFYGYWDWRFCSLLAISTIVDFSVGKFMHTAVEEKIRKRYLLLSVFVNLGILGIFKYFNFFIGSIDAVVQGFGGQVDYLHLNIILPVGISFYTFQTMSYTLDVFLGRSKASKSFLDFALYVTFFPQLVAVPIVRATQFLPQCLTPRRATRNQFHWGLFLLTWGLFQKVVLADAMLSPAAEAVFGFAGGPLHAFDAWLGVLAFSGQIFFDFAGYSTTALPLLPGEAKWIIPVGWL